MGAVFRSRPTSRLALLPFGILLSLSLFSRSAQATCYFPDGSTADSGHKECSPNSRNATTCCADGFQCLSNGLCNDQRYENWGRLLRGACTDKDFGGNCTDVCRDIWPQGDEVVWYCGSGNYCCSRNNDCCDNNSVEKKNIGEPSVVATAGSSSPSTSSTSSSSSSATASFSSTPSTTPAPASSGGGTNTKTVAIAVGTVAGVLLLALLTGGFIFFRRKRKARANVHVMHELSGPSQATDRGFTEPRAYQYDDKQGGWVGPAPNVHLHEAHTDHMVELPTQAEAKEMDTPMRTTAVDEQGVLRSPTDATRRPMPAEGTVGLRSPVGSTSRRSRFVEVGVEGADTTGVQHPDIKNI